jgi:hypothetical protein
LAVVGVEWCSACGGVDDVVDLCGVAGADVGVAELAAVLVALEDTES